MESNPEPSPNDKQCFNCGKDLETHATFCPHCGAPLFKEDSPLLKLMRAIGASSLSGFALLFGSCGACFMLFSVQIASNADTLGLQFGLIGLFLLGLTLLCIWGVSELSKRKKLTTKHQSTTPPSNQGPILSSIIRAAITSTLLIIALFCGVAGVLCCIFFASHPNSFNFIYFTLALALIGVASLCFWGFTRLNA